MQNNSRNKLNSTLISNASKELIKQKYIEKDYRDYLNRDPFQKDKVDSLAKQLFKAITKIIKAILS